MVLDVTRTGPQFVADGEDSDGKFTLTGDLGERGEDRTWTKSYADGTAIRWETMRVGESTGFVGRWTRDGAGEGEFAIWPGTSEQSPPNLLMSLPTESITFRCVCGEMLELPAEAPGLEMDCPWCLKAVVAPSAGGDARLAEPKAPPADPENYFRCPGCGSPAIDPTIACLLCGASTLAPESFELLTAALDQEVVAPDLADWTLRKFAWLIRTQGKEETFRRPLVFPSRDWWPAVWVPGEGAAVSLLDGLQRGAGLERLPLDLRILDEEEEALRDGVPASAEATACIYEPPTGSGTPEIAIGAGALKDGVSLAGIFSHGLSHLQLDQRLPRQSPPPLDREQLVDLLGITLGFGIFQCEAAFRVLSWTLPRRSKHFDIARIGYLSQAELSFAMALWCCARGMNVEDVPRHLSANGKGYFKEAYRFFDDRPELVGNLRAGSVESA
jgi:hypothetical protein